ncbi:MAG: hypothetical protein NTW19_01405, partial [Planctomycetota bacterium]|nr:hypothetical protein [Planctomycetota bacterium]
MGRTPVVQAFFGFPTLRQYWQAVRREEREAAANQRARRKGSGKTRPKCRCKAYPWPHRPAGGFCRFPDPPTQCWQRTAASRPYRQRYAGLRRQIARSNGLHPIRDRAAIDALVPGAVNTGKWLKRGQLPQLRFRNIEITPTGFTLHLPKSGPDWSR